MQFRASPTWRVGSVLMVVVVVVGVVVSTFSEFASHALASVSALTLLGEPTATPTLELLRLSTVATRRPTFTPSPTTPPSPTAEPAPVLLPTVTPTRPTPTPIPTAWTLPTPPPPTAEYGGNLRSGPGIMFEVVGQVQGGEVLEIVARNPQGDWFLLKNGAWVAGILVLNTPVVAETTDLPPLPGR